MHLTESIPVNSRQGGSKPPCLPDGNPYRIPSAAAGGRSPDGNEKQQAGKERFTIVLEPIASNTWRTTPIQRLRAALKLLLRGFGLRAVRIVPNESAVVSNGNINGGSECCSQRDNSVTPLIAAAKTGEKTPGT